MSIKIFCRESFNNSRIKPMAERHNGRTASGLSRPWKKAAQIYMLTCNMPRVNTIKAGEMQQLAEYFGVGYRKDFLNL